MTKIKTVVRFEEGLHARPASELVKLCQKATSNIKITRGENTIDPKSILGILTLGASFNDEIEIEVSGEDESETILNLEAFFAESH